MAEIAETKLGKVSNIKYFHNKVPSYASYNLMQYATSNNYIAGRQMKRFVPVTGNVYGDGVLGAGNNPNVCRINISGPFGMDTLNSYLTFRLSITKDDAAATCRLLDSGHSVLSELLILDKEGNTLELIRDYNILHSMLSTLTVSKDYRNSLGGRAEGYGDHDKMIYDFGLSTTLAGVPTTYTRSFCLNLMSGILKNEKVLPMAVMRGIQIVLTFDRAVNCLTGSAAPTDYKIFDVAYMCEALSFSEEYMKRLVSASLGGIKLPFHSYGFTTVNQDGTTMHSVVSRTYSQVKTVFAVHTLSTDRNDIGKRPDTFYSCKLLNYQFENGTHLYPQQPIKVDDETSTSIAQLQQSLRYLGDVSNDCPIDEMFYYDKGVMPKGAGNYNSDANPLNNDDSRPIAAVGGTFSITLPENRYLNRGSKCIIGQEFERDSYFTSTVNTDDSPLVLTTTYSAVTGNLQIKMYTHYDGLLTIFNGKLTVDK